MKKPKTIPRSIKHTFTAEERDVLSHDLVNALDQKTSTEMEFDAIKSSFKARIAESESRVNTIAANIRAGFEMRVVDCVVVFRREEGEKDFHLAADWGTVNERPVLTEKMTEDDYQQELFDAEAEFDQKTAIELFKPTATDFGSLIVGYLEKRWYSALRVKVGSHELSERLDSEQQAFKSRADAIRIAAGRALKWLKEKTGDSWKGFEAAVKAATEAEKEKVE
jgi:hypothetical protein